MSPRRISKQTVALHKSAHFAAAQAEGFGAHSATIHNGDDWEGRAYPLRSPCLKNPDDLLRKVRIVLAGPLAVELFGDVGKGSASDNVEEILKARIIVTRAAELSERKKAPLWQATLVGTAQRVEHYALEISALSVMLARRQTIRASEPSIKRILQRVDARPFQPRPLSRRGEGVVVNISAILREFCRDD